MGETDLDMTFSGPLITQVDAGSPIAVLAGAHLGCFAYGQWREYDPEDTLRFYALRLREVGMIDPVVHDGFPERVRAHGRHSSRWTDAP